jgi:hypothetical protein
MAASPPTQALRTAPGHLIFGKIYPPFAKYSIAHTGVADYVGGIKETGMRNLAEQYTGLVRNTGVVTG